MKLEIWRSKAMILNCCHYISCYGAISEILFTWDGDRMTFEKMLLWNCLWLDYNLFHTATLSSIWQKMAQQVQFTRFKLTEITSKKKTHIFKLQQRRFVIDCYGIAFVKFWHSFFGGNYQTSNLITDFFKWSLPW